MRAGRATLWTLAFLAPGLALAEAPGTSLRPMPRPVAQAAEDAEALAADVLSSLQATPSAPAPEAADIAAEVTGAITATALAPVAEVAAQLEASAEVSAADAPPASTATARAPVQSLRPMPRPGAAPESALDTSTAANLATASAASEALASSTPVEISALAPAQSLRPGLRPASIARAAAAYAAAQQAAPIRPQGSGAAAGSRICGDRNIRGQTLAAIQGRLSGCGIPNPVRVTEIEGVRLNQPATINCDTARAVQRWINDSVIPTVGRYGGGVVGLRVVASYSCRTRNNRPGARLSEHATGNGIDIAGIRLADGSELTVLSDWRSGREGRMLREMHRGACGPFGTVLGPESDRYHQDHFHFDVANYRSGPYCR